ncbi:MAG: ATP-binding cassette domain-containing protein [Phycisphaerales bacterium]|nr:ATP-binding cassette domain-containing protein [Phycisphaerales bacterium]
MMSTTAFKNGRYLVPEVVQTSAMDCGPASLKALLDGFGISVSYGRLREACQTEVDGTSIDTLEEVAAQLGLEATQTLVPVDHVLLPEAQVLPAIAVVRLPNGQTHFLVLWRKHGQFVQVMDPATGRRWPASRELLNELYVHGMPVPAAAWRAWAGTDGLLKPLRSRLQKLGMRSSTCEQLIRETLADESWRPIACLDGATRQVESLIRSGGLRRGMHAAGVVQSIFRQTLEPDADSFLMPPSYWCAQPAPAGPNGEEMLFVQGAVVVKATKRKSTARLTRKKNGLEEQENETRLPDELAAALKEPPTKPTRELFKLLRADGLLAPLMIALTSGIAAAAVVLEALIFRGFLEMGTIFNLSQQRLLAVGAILVFVMLLLCLEWPLMLAIMRLGRHLEARLRVAFLKKIPRLSDRYFHSRLTSDMAERSHSVQVLRGLPSIGAQLLRSVFSLGFTMAGIIWLDPGCAPLAIMAAVASVTLPMIFQPYLAQRDLRLRTHMGAISRFYLDALLGLIPIRTHRAERAVRREHESLLVEWTRAGLGVQRAAVATQGMFSLVSFGLVAWLLFDHLARTTEIGGMLLLVYWALNLPNLGQQVTVFARQYPAHRNITLRLLEPLGALEESEAIHKPSSPDEADSVSKPKPRKQPTLSRHGVSVSLRNVTIRAGGHEILRQVNLDIEPGADIAIVGESGAGKSSLVGLLLGWHKASDGTVLLDNTTLSGEQLSRLRSETAWVDPAIHLWNRSLMDNLHYGIHDDTTSRFSRVVKQADLLSVLEAMPDGFQTSLGEGGAFVSGGEGQRVRLGRAMLRADARLAILDEPFRGLDRDRRRCLLKRARAWWKNATLFCVTHDIAETLDFDHVIVIDHGRVIEQGPPKVLAEKTSSQYRAMLEAEEEVRTGLWTKVSWRRLWLDKGRLAEDSETAN